MVEPGPPAPLILSPEAARQRFALYVLVKLAALGAFFGGVYISRNGGTMALVVVLLMVGAAGLFVRPRHLGLTTRPER